jgi:hypothetical protein
MAAGTLAVRDALGPDVPGITDADIREALWHYYYDIGKTVTWLLDSRIDIKRTAKRKSGENKKKGGLDFSFFRARDAKLFPAKGERATSDVGIPALSIIFLCLFYFGYYKHDSNIWSWV